MPFLGLISVYRNVFLVFCPRILFYYDISVTLFCVQKSFSSRPRNVILRHHNYIGEGALGLPPDGQLPDPAERAGDRQLA